MKALFIFNDAPYGSERINNGLRLAGSLSKREGVEIKVFLIGDAVGAAHKGQKVPTGTYNVQTMFGTVVRHKGIVGVCGSCMDARGMTEAELIEDTHRSSMEELTSWTLDADRVITF
jgi:uncharacterized protein involved in oxidation of intracellular sulfur